MAAAISALFYDHARVFVVDPEAAWQFLIRRIFDVEDIELIQRPFSTFKDMVSSLYEAEKLGACCWIVDPLTLISNELLDSFKQKLGYIPIDKWMNVRRPRTQNSAEMGTFQHQLPYSGVHVRIRCTCPHSLLNGGGLFGKHPELGVQFYFFW
jgi:hypothetical protein